MKHSRSYLELQLYLSFSKSHKANEGLSLQHQRYAPQHSVHQSDMTWTGGNIWQQTDSNEGEIRAIIACD